jgi:4-hydroxysphinganine ceramide fatty acyl 2-hydroxylase
VTLNGNVYNVTSFLDDHPGGDDLVLDYAGKDIATILADASSHKHSKAAYEMLEDFKIGELGGESSVDDGEFPVLACIARKSPVVPRTRGLRRPERLRELGPGAGGGNDASVPFRSALLHLALIVLRCSDLCLHSSLGPLHLSRL